MENHKIENGKIEIKNEGASFSSFFHFINSMNIMKVERKNTKANIKLRNKKKKTNFT